MARPPWTVVTVVAVHLAAAVWLAVEATRGAVFFLLLDAGPVAVALATAWLAARRTPGSWNGALGLLVLGFFLGVRSGGAPFAVGVLATAFLLTRASARAWHHVDEHEAALAAGLAPVPTQRPRSVALAATLLSTLGASLLASLWALPRAAGAEGRGGEGLANAGLGILLALCLVVGLLALLAACGLLARWRLARAGGVAMALLALLVSFLLAWSAPLAWLPFALAIGALVLLHVRALRAWLDGPRAATPSSGP